MKFQDNLIYNEKIHEKIVRTRFIDVQSVKYISYTYFCPNFIKMVKSGSKVTREEETLKLNHAESSESKSPAFLISLC